MRPTPQWSIREVITRMNEQDLNNPVVEEKLDADTPESVQEQSEPAVQAEAVDTVPASEQDDTEKREQKDAEAAFRSS